MSKPKTVAKFHKVPLHYYVDAVHNFEPNYDETACFNNLEELKLPARGTRMSAGYDFFADRDYTIPPGGDVVVTTGVSISMDEGWFLALYPRSGMAFKTGLRLSNSTGIIDGDFIYGNTRGHILVKILNHDSMEPIVIHKGDRFCQGIIQRYGLAEGDDAWKRQRTGGTGSTGA